MDEEEIEAPAACTLFFHRHPLLFCFLLFLAFTYAFVYPVFAFILAYAPVLLLTALLLGLVLLNSVTQDHDPHVYKKISRRPPQCQPSTNAVAVGGSRRHHHRPSRESPPTSDSSSSSSSSADDNYNDKHRPTMSTTTSLASFPDAATNSDSESTDSEPDRPHHHGENHHQQQHQRSEKEAVRAVAWTAEDDKSIENIGSLELEMNATVEKLMSRRRARGHQRPLQHHQHHVVDLVDIDDASKLSFATRKSNPFDLDAPYDDDDNFPDSAPSMLGLRPSRNPFFDDDDNLHLHAPPLPQQSSTPGAVVSQKNAMLFRRHESFTVGAPYVSDFRPSRFRPYFVTEKMQGQPVTDPEASRKSSSSSTSSSSAGANAYAYASANKEEEAAAEQEALAEAEAAAMLEAKTDEYSSRSHEVVAVDVELISDSSDDDMSLHGGDAEKEYQVKVQQQQQVAEKEQQMKLQQQQMAEEEQRMKVQQQQLAEQELRMKVQQQQQQQQLAEQELQMKAQQQQQLAVSDDDDEEGESFEVESITKQVAAAAAGKTKQLETDPAYDYSPSAAKMEKKQPEALAQLPPVAPNKLQSMRRVFSEEDADEPWVAPSALEETTGTTTENEAREQDMFPLPPLPESAAGAPPLSAATKKAVGKSTKYKPPSKKAVLGFFRK